MRSSTWPTTTRCWRRPRERDAELARGASRGWMHGMPQAIKDAASAIGFPTTYGSVLLKDNVARVDGVMVERMKAAGCIVIGKTNMPEFGLGSHTYNNLFGVTGNAWDPTRQRRRLQRRRRGVPGAAPAAGGRRLRLHGQPAQPGRVEPRVRPAAEPGPRAAVAGRRCVDRATRHRRADGAQRARPRDRCCRSRPATIRARRCRSRRVRRTSRRARRPLARHAHRVARRSGRASGARARHRAGVRAGAAA